MNTTILARMPYGKLEPTAAKPYKVVVGPKSHTLTMHYRTADGDTYRQVIVTGVQGRSRGVMRALPQP
jgi:hypothetical protein